MGRESEKKVLKTTFIAVHLGAGEHPEKRSLDYKKICDEACKKALKSLKAGGSAGEAVVIAVKVLEDSKLLNAGSGSNLTLDGTVECDAGFMDGEGYFGGVGAVPGVPNPVKVAKALADVHRTKKLLSCGRIPPNFIVGQGAKSWASTAGISTCEDKEMISRKAQKTYEKYKKDLNSVDLRTEVNDTVGAIALDQDGHVASAVSSGGNWMKFPGRIGHSPLFGCGCWSSNSTSSSDSAVAVSISGSGEMLSRLRLAQECGVEAKRSSEYPQPNVLTSTVRKHFIENQLLNIHSEPRYIGVIALDWDGRHGQFSYIHSSKNFPVAYMKTGWSNAKFEFSEMEPGSVAGVNFVSVGSSF